MPLYRHWKEGDAEWGIWKVCESAEELRAMLTGGLPYDVGLDSLKAQGRKMEYLAVRVLLKTLTGRNIIFCMSLPVNLMWKDICFS